MKSQVQLDLGLNRAKDAKVERWLCLYLTHITPALQFQQLPREDL